MATLSLVIVTGMSGAGKSTAAKVLEDLGYYTIDNMPLMVIERFTEIFFDMEVVTSKIALVMDVRSGDLEVTYKTIKDLQEKCGAKVIFLNASTEELLNRFKANRRAHPLGGDVLEAITKEELMLRDIKSIADIVIDTSRLNIHEFAAQLSDYFKGHSGGELSITVGSFGYKHGVPVDSDLVFDVRFIKNPYFVDTLRDKTGLSDDVANYVMQDPVAQKFFLKLLDLILFLIPEYIREGKRFLKISIGCTGGRHRSVTIAEKLAKTLDASYDSKGIKVQVRHRDIER